MRPTSVTYSLSLPNWLKAGAGIEFSFDETGWRPAERLAVARELGDTSLMFLVHPTLTDAEIEKTCSVLSEVMTLATSRAV